MQLDALAKAKLSRDTVPAGDALGEASKRLMVDGRSGGILMRPPEALRRLCRGKAIAFIKVTSSEYRFALTDLEEYVASRRNKRASGVR